MHSFFCSFIFYRGVFAIKKPVSLVVYNKCKQSTLADFQTKVTEANQQAMAWMIS